MNIYLLIAQLGALVVVPFSFVVMNTKGTTQKVFLGIQLTLLMTQIACVVIGLNQ